jgi:ribulose-5-phosphate 4-epimerase/fuculose-1-phosphate aldolase
MSEVGKLVRERVGEEEWALRVELAAAYRVFAMFGWTHLIHTHITVKVPGEKECFLINPFGLLWEEITASSLVKVDAEGGIVDHGSTESSINPAGFKIHSAIHVSERAANWVMHIHVPEVNAVANLKGGLVRGLSVYSMDIGGISYHDFEHATSSSSDVCGRMILDLGSVNKVLLLPNHGAITIGDSIHEAFYLTYQLVEACKVQIMTQSCANSDLDYSVVDEQTVEETYRIVQDNYTGNEFGKLEWEAAKRKMLIQPGPNYAE